jgi:dUTP pyrophosphatase
MAGTGCFGTGLLYGVYFNNKGKNKMNEVLVNCGSERGVGSANFRRIDCQPEVCMEANCQDLFPAKAHDADAGFDLRAAEDIVLLKNEVKSVSAGFRISLPDGWEAQIRPRSGLAAKHGLTVVNSPGTVDSGYIGVVRVLLRYGGMGSPEGDAPFLKIKRGDRVAQMVIQRVPYVVLKPVDELGKTDRGDNGFGSTGVS